VITEIFNRIPIAQASKMGQGLPMMTILRLSLNSQVISIQPAKGALSGN